MAKRTKEKRASYDVVVGGGLSGMCAAIASARHGARTALIHARHVSGGNASSEIRMHICGASENMAKPDLEEGGILYELMLANKCQNDYFSYSTGDMVLFSAVKKQPNLTTYLNTTMEDCVVEDDCLRQITAYQQTTETRLFINGRIFIDCTGNGTLAILPVQNTAPAAKEKRSSMSPMPWTNRITIAWAIPCYSKPSTEVILSDSNVLILPENSPRKN